MAGGAGERFWPVSRLARPKQLLKLSRPDMNLLEEAVQRVEPLFGRDGVYIATGKSVEEPIRGSGAVPEDQVWVEPLKRNTLGCLCWAAAHLLAQGEENVAMAILTADHRIGPDEDFRDCVSIALDTAVQRQALVTIGIRPTRPETGFGYIEVDKDSETPQGVYAAQSFREKPDAETAQSFLDAGNFLWNSGMFFWTLADFMRELDAAQPEAASATRRMGEQLAQGNLEAAEATFAELPNISIDFALMEKAKNVAVVISRFEWDDVGSWDALERSFEADPDRNVTFGNALTVEADGCVVYNDSDRTLVTALGVSDLLIVVTPDAVMVCPKSEAQRVKEIVQRVKEQQPELT